MNNEEIEKKALRGMQEFEAAWQEFFKNKPKPKNDEEDRKQQEEFHHWYNYIRKQSDTGKTPAEMYKEAYGKEPPKKAQEPSRMMNFDWDEDEWDDAQEEAVVIATEIFEDSWKQIKQEMEGQGRKELCKYSFIFGFLSYMKMMDEKAKLIEKEMKNMSKDDIQKMIDSFKEYGSKKRDE